MIPLLWCVLIEIFFFELILMVAIIRGQNVKTKLGPFEISLFSEGVSPDKKELAEKRDP